jgi:hypothetical protein
MQTVTAPNSCRSDACAAGIIMNAAYKAPTFEPSFDGLGAMVCTTSDVALGNASTCGCQSWDWTCVPEQCLHSRAAQ